MKPSRLVAALAALLVIVALAVYLRPVRVLEAAGELRLRWAGVRSRDVEVGPYRLRYFEAGRGEPLLLVHGLGSSALVEWGRELPSLAHDYHVYAPDLPGFGRSERSPSAPYGIPMQVEAVRAFLQAVGVPRARVVGISMGGWISARLAIEHPELVERLVLVAPAGMRPEDSAPVPAEALLPRDEAGVRRLLATVRSRPPALPSFLARDMLRQQLREQWVVRRTLESMRAGNDWLNGRLGAIRAPVLLLWGTKDVLIPPSYAEPIQAELPGATLVRLEGCGHVVPGDCPEEFARELRPFLAATDLRPAALAPAP
jgi:pimeloyl-ACP methyl ester carboxylesterase